MNSWAERTEVSRRLQGLPVRAVLLAMRTPDWTTQNERGLLDLRVDETQERHNMIGPGVDGLAWCLCA